MVENDDRQKTKNMTVSVIATIAITLIALLALNKIVEEVSISDVINGIVNVGPERFLIAVLFTTICYIALSGYDYIALDSLGKRTRWLRTLIGSTAAYSLSHNLGFAPITATYARHKVYQHDGVGLVDVAKVVVLTGAAFWLGVILSMGIALTIVPEIDIFRQWGLTRADQKIIGFAIIGFVLFYFFLIYRGMKVLGFGKWSVPLPTLRNAVVQTGISLVEMAFASAVLWILIPGSGIENYPYIAVAYVTAFVMVLITHAPGGVGVLESIIILMIPEMPKAELLSALLLFRLVFHILPLITGLLILFSHRSKAFKIPQARVDPDILT
jgi:phosphatidylglycerol lysyltransferase